MCESCEKDQYLIELGFYKINIPSSRLADALLWTFDIIGPRCDDEELIWDYRPSNLGVDFYFKDSSLAVSFKLSNFFMQIDS